MGELFEGMEDLAGDIGGGDEVLDAQDAGSVGLHLGEFAGGGVLIDDDGAGEAVAGAIGGEGGAGVSGGGSDAGAGSGGEHVGELGGDEAVLIGAGGVAEFEFEEEAAEAESGGEAEAGDERRVSFAEGGGGHDRHGSSGLHRLSTVDRMECIMQLHGVVPPIGTPLTENDRVDTAGLTRLAHYLVDAGVHGILANGTMGGFAFLKNEEQLRSIATTVEAVNGRVPVMGGLGETSTSRAVAMAKEIAAQGVDALSMLPPFYFYGTQDHLMAYFSEIAAAVDIPVYLYDNPVLTKNPIHPETIAKLRSRIPHLRGIKVSNQDCVNLQNILTLMKGDEEFSILTGSEFLIVVALQMGCHGCVGGLHNVCPRIAVELYEAYRGGDLEKARERQQELKDAWQIFQYGSIWGAFDEALRWLGICERATGAPYVTALREEERSAVVGILEKHVRPYLLSLA